MSEQSVPIAFKCKRCDAWVELRVVRTERPDHEGRELFNHLQNFLKNVALCNDCLGYYNTLARDGRSEEFWKA